MVNAAIISPSAPRGAYVRLRSSPVSRVLYNTRRSVLPHFPKVMSQPHRPPPPPPHSLPVTPTTTSVPLRPALSPPRRYPYAVPVAPNICTPHPFVHDASPITETCFPSRTHACHPDPGGFYSKLFEYPSASAEHDPNFAGCNGSFTCGVCKNVCTGVVYHCHKCNKYDECPPCAGKYPPSQKMA